MATEPTRWNIQTRTGLSILIYKQILLMRTPRRTVSVEISDDHNIVLSNQPRAFEVGFAHFSIAFVALWEAVALVMFFNMTGCGSVGCGHMLTGILLLLVGPLFLMLPAPMFWSDYMFSRGLFIQLAEHLVALPGVAYCGPEVG
ncbi:MAG: hypothetical protein ISS15_10340 [Alphaproteobacteria bacterium]|nr:hypothetical protein [Alphaproteobacteria bacterium]MBL6938595.1 hypothetical protein [Alphaproteobacteria bacterium]MBL7098048.1 hypothetical protein [Alphaproteobacteria bacterium]